jgi:hypothetical protein
MTAIVNYAPFLCNLLPSNFSRMHVCGRLPRDASPALNDNSTAIVRGATVIVESSLVANAHAPAVRFEEIPTSFQLKTSWLVDGTRQPVVSWNQSIDLDGSALTIAAAKPNKGKLRFDVSGSDFDGAAVGSATLPQQLWPHMVPGQLFASHVPTRGVWEAGAIVWAAPAPAASSQRTVGWVCDVGGTPGEWRNFSV